jgi:hypothetical protein
MAYDTILKLAQLHTAVDMSIPEGALRLDEGRFILWYPKAHVKLMPKIVAGLKHIEVQYASAGLPLRGKVECIVRGAKGSVVGSSFYQHPNLIQLNPKSLGHKHEHGHLTHEIAHWQHDMHVSGGYSNSAIVAKYKAALAAPVSQGETAVRDTQKDLARVKEERKQLGDQYLKPLVQKGVLFDAAREFGKGPGTANYKVLKVKSKSVEVLVLNPGQFDKAPFTAELEGWRVNEAVSKTNPSLRMELSKLHSLMEEKRKEEEDLRSGVQKGVIQNWDQYDTVKSDWMPTVYARKNHKEWFAEIVTTMILSPGLLKDEVKDWVKSVW